jgi:hypothetical protein
MWMSFMAGLLGTAMVVSHCLVESVCYNDADCSPDRFCDQASGKCLGKCRTSQDCPAGNVCNPATGVCSPVQCQLDTDCSRGLECEDGRCVFCDPFRCNPIQCEEDAQCAEGFTCTNMRCISAALECPEGMVSIEDEFCIDIYEASRPDATASRVGTDESMATSRENVMPWQFPSMSLPTENATALAACRAAGKTLCTEGMWFKVCRGPQELVYAYGDDYVADICNGIDKFCSCTPPSPCAGRDPCPYPHCRDDCPDYSDTPFHLEPTPTDPRCTNEFGVYDINGNVWEHVKGGDGTRIRGGAFNCADSVTLHRCDYIPGVWTPSARGFRCCSLGMPE